MRVTFSATGMSSCTRVLVCHLEPFGIYNFWHNFPYDSLYDFTCVVVYNSLHFPNNSIYYVVMDFPYLINIFHFNYHTWFYDYMPSPLLLFFIIYDTSNQCC